LTSSKRQRELARRRAERQAARRAQAARKQRRRSVVSWAVGLAVLALLIAVPVYRAVTKQDAEAASPNAEPTATATPTSSAEPTASAAPGTCTYTKAQEGGKDVGLPPATGFDQKPRTATVELSAGTIAFEMLSANAPCTVNSFAHLAGKKYFDGSKCHRLTTEGIFVLQCGDPTGTGSGGPGYQFADENLESAKYPAGTVAMANAGPGTNGSQFFLVYKDTELPPNYTPFGKITSGLDVINKIAAAGTKDGKGDGAPKTDVTISSFTVKAG
jgi:peptidyl-prolyl cis-trans isomerase B (cyclophilin B)